MAPVLPAASQDLGDAPDHGVARISVLNGGDITVRRGDTGERVDAELNDPLVSPDHVITGDRSRAEIQFDSTNLLRLAPDTEVRLADLQQGDYLIEVVRGTVTLRVLRQSNAKVELSGPTASLVPRDDGTYRVTVNEDFSMEMTVRSGESQVFIENTSDFLRSGQTLVVRGDLSNPQRMYRAAIPLDDWDRWNENRDHDIARSDTYRYVSSDIYGAYDLTDYGRWVYDAPYGWVWVPTVDASWAPYRVGRWSYIDYYGWTWVSGDPWGWAPYHYGRWYYGPRYGWSWYPGGVAVRYTWRPALVAFFGWGTNIGWVPLAPYEVYRPWYGPGHRVAVNNITVINNIDVINTYHNVRFVSGRSGVTSLASGDFGHRRTAVNNFIVGTDRDFSRASDADHLLGRQPDRRDVPRNVRVVDAQRPSETVRRTAAPPRRNESIAFDRAFDNNNNRSRVPEDSGRRSQPRRDDNVGVDRGRPSNGRAFDNNSNNDRSRVPEDSGRRSQPRREDNVGVDRGQPSNGRAFDNNSNNDRSRVPEDGARRSASRREDSSNIINSNGNGNRGRSESFSAQPSRAPEESPRRSEAPRSEPSRGRPPETVRQSEESPRRAETPRSEPERQRPQNPEPRRVEPPPAATSSPGIRNRPDDNDRPASRSAASPESSSSQNETPRGNPGRGRGR
jgi:hypothetical protein